MPKGSPFASRLESPPQEGSPAPAQPKQPEEEVFLLKAPEGKQEEGSEWEPAGALLPLITSGDDI